MDYFIIHQCILLNGPQEGNTHTVKVRPEDIDYGTCCKVCGEPLVSLTKAIAAVYEELLETEPPPCPVE